MRKLCRRDFLKVAIAAASGAAGSPELLAADEAKSPEIIDTHTHFYDPARPEGVPWPNKNDALLYRTVLPAEFARLTGPLGVTGTVVVEASPWLEDNQWVLDLAAKEPLLVGMVGNLTPGSDGFAAQLDRFAKNPLFRGLRILGASLGEGLSRKPFVDDLRRLADTDRELDVNGRPDMLPDVARLAREIPKLRIVINHVANARIDGKPPDAAWLSGMRSAAAGENVFCKVSALVESTGRREGDAPADVEYYRPVLDALWQTFGEGRLIYGSNWPVSERFAPYRTVLGIVREYFTARGSTAAKKFFAANAQAAYRWPQRH